MDLPFRTLESAVAQSEAEGRADTNSRRQGTRREARACSLYFFVTVFPDVGPNVAQKFQITPTPASNRAPSPPIAP